MCLIELKERFYLLNTLCACVLVMAAAYSVHALDKLYSILCTFELKFLTNSKKKKENDIIIAGEQNLYFSVVNFINAHK